MEKTEVSLIQLRDPQHFQDMKEVDCGSCVEVLFINKKILLSAATAFKTTCTKCLVELSNKIRKRFFSSKCSLTKNLDRPDPKIAMSPNHGNLSIVPLLKVCNALSHCSESVMHACHQSSSLSQV